MPKINLNKFKVVPFEKLDTKEKVVQTTAEMFIASEDFFKRHTRLEGYIRNPKDKKCKWAKTYAERKDNWMNLIVYLNEKDLFWNKLQYTRIEYKGGKDRSHREWQAYERLLMNFIDYILPKMPSESTQIKNVIYCDHVFQKHFNPSFHIVYEGKDVYEFEALWNEYLEAIQKDYPTMLEYEEVR